MLNSIIRHPAMLITLPLLTLIAASYPANAEIYKWRDNRGVTQYSDRPPVEGFTKITRNEMVNALQTKDLCTVGPIQKSVASSKNLSGFFGFNINKASSNTNTSMFGFPKANATIANSFAGAARAAKPINTGSAATTPAANPASSKPIAAAPVNSNPNTSSPVAAATVPSTSTNIKGAPASNQFLPFAIQSAFKSGSNKVFVLGGPKINLGGTTNVLPTPAPAAPIATLPAPVATPSPVTVVAPPVQVVVNAPTTPPAASTNTSSSSPNLIQVGLMPAVDISKNMIPVVGFNALRVNPTTEIAPYSGGGEFRLTCDASHMSNDDPVVYPNQQGAAHHHTFFGNTSVNYKSNLATLSSTGNSTCRGGIMNRSAYWVPSMIDTATNTPVFPNEGAIFYYKAGSIDGATITAPPKGLRMITGNSKGTPDTVNKQFFNCYPGPNSKRTSWVGRNDIPSGSDCEVGDTLDMGISFPQCWDGKNLDSPNHKDHMAFVNYVHTPVPKYFCPSTHPVALPEVSVHVKFKITKVNQTATWRLASDNYPFNGKNAGSSTHADWVNGWDETFMAGIIKNCINGKKDAHAHLLCDGRAIF